MFWFGQGAISAEVEPTNPVCSPWTKQRNNSLRLFCSYGLCKPVATHSSRSRNQPKAINKNMSIRKCGILLLIQLSLGAIVKQDASNLLQNGSIETQCEYYNSTCFNNHHNLNECQGFVTCKDETHACFVVWNNNTNSLHKSGRNVVLMGCFESNVETE